MTTQKGAQPDFPAHLSRGRLKEALISTLRGIYDEPRLRRWNYRDGPFQPHPLVEMACRTKMADFSASTAPEIFASDGRLEEGMGKLLFQATIAEARAEREVLRLLREFGAAGGDKLSIATSVMSILLNTRYEDALMVASKAARSMMKGRFAFMANRDGSVISGQEFLRVCGMEEFGCKEETGRELDNFKPIVIAADVCLRDKSVVQTARTIARITNEGSAMSVGWGPRAYFLGLLRIAGIIFAEDGERASLVEQYRDACDSLAKCCPEAVESLVHHLGAAARDANDGKRASALITRFTGPKALAELRRVRDDDDRRLEAVTRIAGLEEKNSPRGSFGPN